MPAAVAVILVGLIASQSKRVGDHEKTRRHSSAVAAGFRA
jgi:hypothetical protein